MTPSDKSCPKCGNELMRISRNFSDKIVEAINMGSVKVKRYKCLACFWEGRVSTKSHSHHKQKAVDEEL